MIKSLIFIVIYTLSNIVLCDLRDYDVIIIPLSKHRPRKTINQNKLIGRQEKLDVENYEEPTELPDLNNINYDDRSRDYSRSIRSQDHVSPADETNDSKHRESREYRLSGSNENDRELEYHRDNESSARENKENDDDLTQNNNEPYERYPNNFAEDKIVGGFDVEINLYPYHVAYGTNCGGAIIDKHWVVTAGHCGSKSYIRTGSKNLNQGRKIQVKNHFVHPMWSARNKDHPFDYDFQLLELQESLKFDENVQPIKVAHIEDMIIGKVVTVTGWGNTKENGPYSNILRAVRVPIISKENCQNVPFPYFRGSLTPRMFCAGFKEGKKDACQGDSGGPAVAYDRLLGMVSFGYGCATPGSYGVYSKVAKVRSWIEQTTRLTLS